MTPHLRAIQRRQNELAREPQPEQRRSDHQNEKHCTTAREFSRRANSNPTPPTHLLVENPLRRRIVCRVEAADTNLSFEAALNQLETIVESMESGDVPLAELLAKFEEGNKLLKLCETRLKDAELKIELLKKQKDGVAFTKFETTSEA